MIAISLYLGIAAPLVAAGTYKVPSPGRFDYMAVDAKYRRVLACHTAPGRLTVFDYKTGKVYEVKTGMINGVQVSDKLGKVFVAGKDQMLTVLDRKSLKVGKSVKFNGPCDDIVLDTKRSKVYVCHDDGTEDWVVDARTLHVDRSITVGEAPEYVLYSPSTDRIYQNIKSTDQVQVIDPKAGKVVKNWATGPEKKPHGLAINEKTGHVISVGSNGKADVFDLRSGKLLLTLTVASGVDQIAFDSKLERVYCAAKGSISVIQDGKKPKAIGDITSPEGSHTIAVDPVTHDVWVCSGSESSAQLNRYKVTK